VLVQQVKPKYVHKRQPPSQAGNQLEYSRKPHPLQREDGSGHAATTELSPRNAIIQQWLGNEMLRSTKHVT